MADDVVVAHIGVPLPADQAVVLFEHYADLYPGCRARPCADGSIDVVISTDENIP